MTINNIIKKYDTNNLSTTDIKKVSYLAVKDAYGYESYRKNINYFIKYKNCTKLYDFYIYVYNYILLNFILIDRYKLKCFNYGVSDADKKYFSLNEELANKEFNSLVQLNIAEKFYLKGYYHQLAVIEDYKLCENKKNNTI